MNIVYNLEKRESWEVLLRLSKWAHLQGYSIMYSFPQDKGQIPVIYIYVLVPSFWRRTSCIKCMEACKHIFSSTSWYRRIN